MKHKLIMKQESAKQESMKSTCRLLLVKNAAENASPSQSLASEKEFVGHNTHYAVMD